VLKIGLLFIDSTEDLLENVGQFFQSDERSSIFCEIKMTDLEVISQSTDIQCISDRQKRFCKSYVENHTRCHQILSEHKLNRFSS
jgi:hypothetical protein